MSIYKSRFINWSLLSKKCFHNSFYDWLLDLQVWDHHQIPQFFNKAQQSQKSKLKGLDSDWTKVSNFVNLIFESFCFQFVNFQISKAIGEFFVKNLLELPELSHHWDRLWFNSHYHDGYGQAMAMVGSGRLNFLHHLHGTAHRPTSFCSNIDSKSLNNTFI